MQNGKITKCKHGFLGSADNTSYQALLQELDVHNINPQSYSDFFHSKSAGFNSPSQSSYHSISFLSFTAKFLESTSLLSHKFLTNYSYYLLNLAQLSFPHHRHHCTKTAPVKLQWDVRVAGSLLALHDLTLVTFVVIDHSPFF